MYTHIKQVGIVGLLVLNVWVINAHAAVDQEEADKLGVELSPMGAEIGANADGSIPAWDGGITEIPDGFQSGGHHPDIYSDDEIVLVINKDNMEEHGDRLTEGHKKMLEQYGDTFHMNVYPTRRSASYPQRIYDATKANATTASLIDDGNGITGAEIGIPFPIPNNGLEVIWNHILRYRGVSVLRNVGQAPVTRNGKYTMVMLEDEFYARYSEEGATEESLDNVILKLKQRIKSPSRLVGQIALVHETLNQAKAHRRAWVYNPGQRRVRRAPNIAFDNPGTASDGLRTSDQLDMYNGSPERYDWELLGKKEIYVPYNTYRLHSDQVTYKELIQPQHMNPELLRYELHRVWVVKATLKEGARHIYKTRTFYVDEDSWQVVAVDQYDSRDELWRFSEGHGINYYEVPTYWTTVEVHHDFQSGRYLAVGLNNEEAFTYDFNAGLSDADFTVNALRREGRR